MDTLGLNQSCNPECRVMQDVVLGPLYSPSDPLLLNRVSDIKLSATFLEVPGNSTRVESVRSCVDPIRDVTLDELGRLFLDCHTREEVRNSLLQLVCGPSRGC